VDINFNNDSLREAYANKGVKDLMENLIPHIKN
jgi:hypothetical protein